MKLDVGRDSNSFYESFSDLIFATMAIFVLIVIVLLIQIQPVQEEVVEKKPLELVIAVDGTGSMGETLDELRRAVNAVIEAIPLVTTEFHIGVVIYRHEMESFALTQVVPIEDDNGISYQKVTDFTLRFKPIGAPVSFETAIDAALNMFTQRSARKSLMILGDVGPYEAFANAQKNSMVATCDVTDKESRILAGLRRFTQADEEVNIYTMYTEGASPGPCKNQTIRFFKQIAELGAVGSKYTDDVNKLLVVLLQAALGPTQDE